MTIDRKKEILINILFIAVISMIIFFAFSYLLPYLAPFVIGIIVAIALRRPVDWLTKKTRIPRGIWSAVLVIFTLVSLISILSFVIYKLYGEFSSFLSSLPSYVPSITSAFSSINSKIIDIAGNLPESFKASITKLPETLATSAIDLLTNAVSGTAGKTAVSLPGILVSFIVTIVSCCFITKDYYDISAFIKRQLSERSWMVLSEAKNMFVSNILKLLRSYLLLMTITFCELAIGLSLIGFNYSIVLALLIAVVDILPILGTGTVLIPWGVFLLITGDVVKGICVLVLYAFIAFVRNILEPKIIGKNIGLPTLAVLVAMYVGLKLFGFIGMIGLPITLIIIKNLQDNGYIRIWK